MKRMQILLWVLLALAYPCKGQDGTETLSKSIDPSLPKDKSPLWIFENPQYSIDTTFASRYWDTIVGGIFYTGGPVNFSNFKISYDDPIGTTYAFVGMINPLDTFKYDYNGGTEYYAAVGKTVDIGKTGPKDLPYVRLNLMVLYDAISKIKRMDDDVVQQYVRIELPRVPQVQPYVEGYHWFQTGNRAPPVGYFGRAGVHRQQPLGFSFRGTKMELGLDASMGWSSEGLFGTSSGLAYYRGIASMVFKWNDRFKIIPSIIGQLPGTQDKNRAFVDHSRVYYNLTLVYDLK